MENSLETQWKLASCGADGTLGDFVITRLPCRVGRAKENDLVIANLGLSRLHASLERDITGRIRVVDHDSTNGTFVNRQRVDGFCLLKGGDQVQFASAEFRVEQRAGAATADEPAFDEMHTQIIPEHLVLARAQAPGAADLDELITGLGISGAAQPIVDARTRTVIGYELLGRANHPRLPNSPIELFGLAESVDREIDLSCAFRDYGVAAFGHRVAGRMLFINAHPRETFSDQFVAALACLRHEHPQLEIVVELHESAATDIDQLRILASRLARMNIRFAYDDFGAGQARLLELADVPADFVKFDRALIRDLHLASERKQQLVRDLVNMVLAAGSIPLAEGVESEDEARVCVDMGFQLIQGYLTGRPIPPESFVA